MLLVHPVKTAIPDIRYVNIIFNLIFGLNWFTMALLMSINGNDIQVCPTISFILFCPTVFS